MHTIRVDLHCHSVHSDGELTARDLADALAADGVAVAALTDHNSVEGLKEFRRGLARREIGFIPAVEITTLYEGREAHLLAYGIDAAHPELLAILATLRHTYAPKVHSVAESIRTKGAAPNDEITSVPGGKIDLVEAISLIHRAGGCAFLAHPLQLEADTEKLAAILTELKACGLDGIEAFYARFTADERDRLNSMAKQIGLLVCAGTDCHERKAPGSTGIEMPIADWKAFRDAIGWRTAYDQRHESESRVHSRTRFKWRNFIFHIIFPAFLAIALFISAIYVVILPIFERSLIDRKREMIRELTNSAWSILAGIEADERDGRLTREQAQELAISRIASLRYGQGGKDYFWLQDMHPRMIMHPYRPDLNGQDVSTFRDPRGVAIFVAFADLVKREQEGYAVYVWQWKDDPNRLVPKESYVKGFAPWGWIIGTGLYIEDVTSEIGRIEQRLVRTSLVISVVVVLLLLYVVFKSLRLERERAEAEEDLHESTERYRSLVESKTEGTLLVMDHRCRYANNIFLETLGCSPGELELLDLSDLFPEIPDNQTAWTMLQTLIDGGEVSTGFDAVLKRRDDKLVECVITLSRISVAGREGFIVHSRSVEINTDTESLHETIKRDQILREVVSESPVGIFRARVTARGTITAHNQAAGRLLALNEDGDHEPPALADLFIDANAYDEFLADLQRDGETIHRIHHIGRDAGIRTVAITARLMRDGQGAPRSINGFVTNITNQYHREAELEATIQRLQTTLLFLHEPISRLTQRAVFCHVDAAVVTAAAMMTEQHASAIFVQTESGSVVGIITDKDIRRRVVADGLDRNTPAHLIMTAPIVTINEQSLIYEAMLLMEQRQVNHLAVTDDSGRIVGTICHQELMQFQQYSPVVLTREIERASTPHDIIRSCKGVPGLVKVLLDFGAHSHVISRLISSVCDAATIRFIALAESEIGPAPAPFVFIALGSQGRQEMTLSSDQDNAIIYEALADPDQNNAVREYFMQLGRRVCEWLDRAGYPFCRGEAMAQNPQWCQPLSVWKDYFRDWIERAEPQQLLEFSIFFDFRPIHGQNRLTAELSQYIFDLLSANPAFYPHFAQNALQFKPPKRMFGRIIGSGGGKEQGSVLDAKDAVIPIISFARLYALRQGMDVTNTYERLQRLTETDVFNETSSQAIVEALEFLTRLNLKQQGEAAGTGQVIDNKVHLRHLGPIEQTMLHQSLTQVDVIQKKINYDFLSGMA
ncbi:MAG: DUF294 nucleotidyltransferase-like domain-containing protein [Calditrichota bacterium]